MAETQRHTIVLFSVVFFTILFFCVLTYERVFLLRDYTVVGESSCDPTSESCFIYECDPQIEECTGDPEQDVWYYKQVEKVASSVSFCDPAITEECPELSCTFGEYGCKEIYCDPKEEFDICAEPIEPETSEDGDTAESTNEDNVQQLEGGEEDLPSETESENPETIQ